MLVVQSLFAPQAVIIALMSSSNSFVRSSEHQAERRRRVDNQTEQQDVRVDQVPPAPNTLDNAQQHSAPATPSVVSATAKSNKDYTDESESKLSGSSEFESEPESESDTPDEACSSTKQESSLLISKQETAFVITTPRRSFSRSCKARTKKSRTLPICWKR